MRPSKKSERLTPGAFLWELLTFQRLLVGPVLHLVYWAGLALILLGGFGTVGGAIGMGLKEPSFMGWFLALPFLVGGLLVMFALLLLWRGFCEFYVAVMRISEDLRAIRQQQEAAAKPADQRIML